MTFTYQTSAAGISWLALAAALDSQAQRQKDLLNLYSNNCNVAIQETQVNANAAFDELSHEAQGEQAQGIAGLCGVAAGSITAIGSYGMEMSHLKAAQEIESPTKNSIGVSQKNTPSTTEDIELEEVSTSAKVNVEPSNSENSKSGNTPNNTQGDTSKTNKTNPEADMRRNKAMWWQQQASNFTGFSNQIGTSSGNIADAQFKAEAAKAKRDEALAAGIAQVMNAQGQVLTSGTDGTNTQMNNTENTISTIIQISAIRG